MFHVKHPAWKRQSKRQSARRERSKRDEWEAAKRAAGTERAGRMGSGEVRGGSGASGTRKSPAPGGRGAGLGEGCSESAPTGHRRCIARRTGQSHGALGRMHDPSRRRDAPAERGALGILRAGQLVTQQVAVGDATAMAVAGHVDGIVDGADIALHVAKRVQALDGRAFGIEALEVVVRA